MKNFKMKNFKINKSNIKNIFIIIISVFILVPLMLMFFDIKKEGLIGSGEDDSGEDDSGEDVSDVDVSGVDVSDGVVSDGVVSDLSEQSSDKPLTQNENKFNLDRVKVPDVQQTETEMNNKYMYCLGGKIECPSGTFLSSGLPYSIPSSTNIIGKTYNMKCLDSNNNETDKKAMCKNSFFEKQNSFKFDSSCNEANKLEFTLSESSDASGFTTAFEHVPLSVDDKFVYLYNENQELHFKSDKCYLEGNPELCCGNIQDVSSSNTTGDINIKCNASFGSNIGDPLCCEQPGVVQNTKFICPSELPTCMGYKCGESWGKCTMRTNLSE